jgi:hypothetical protein
MRMDRLHFQGTGGHIVRAEAFLCDDHAGATEMAEEMSQGRAATLWQAARPVAVLPEASPIDAPPFVPEHAEDGRVHAKCRRTNSNA